MHVTVDTASFLPHPPEAALDALAAVGLESVEISLGAILDSIGDQNLILHKELDRLSDVLAKRRLTVATWHLGGDDPSDPSWPDRTARLLRQLSRFSNKLVMLWAGDDYGDPARRQLLLDHHRRVADLANELDTTLAFESQPGLCGDSRGMMGTLAELGSQNVRACYDTGRYLANNPGANGEIALQRICGRLGAVRLTDISLSPDDAALPEFPALGHGGDVDFARTLQILGGIGFDGPCSISFRPRPRGGSPTLEACRKCLADSVRHLRQCGWQL